MTKESKWAEKVGSVLYDKLMAIAEERGIEVEGEHATFRKLMSVMVTEGTFAKALQESVQQVQEEEALL